MTIPQVVGMYKNDRTRKEILVDFGFRLPSALDNRPLTFDEFEGHLNQVVHMSATPGPYELERSEQIVEQLIRPTGVVDPLIEVRPTDGQIDDLHGGDPAAGRARRAGARDDADEEDGRGPRRLPAGARASRSSTSTARSTRSSASRSCATCGSASSTCSSASTSSARASTCPRSRWSRSSTPTRRASCGARGR